MLVNTMRLMLVVDLLVNNTSTGLIVPLSTSNILTKYYRSIVFFILSVFKTTALLNMESLNSQIII